VAVPIAEMVQPNACARLPRSYGPGVVDTNNDPDFSRVTQVGTPRLKRILAESEQQAARRDHGHIGVEHVVLAMLADGRSVPVQLLARHLDLEAFRDELTEFVEAEGYGRH
jgi:hypothetical protein